LDLLPFNEGVDLRNARAPKLSDFDSKHCRTFAADMNKGLAVSS
jgi:hypothetical protein